MAEVEGGWLIPAGFKTSLMGVIRESERDGDIVKIKSIIPTGISVVSSWDHKYDDPLMKRFMRGIQPEWSIDVGRD